MRWLRMICGVAAFGCGAVMTCAQGAQPTAAEKKSATTITLPPSPKALLPDEFDGWVTAEPAKTVTDPVQADPANAAALKEYGFNAAVEASYKREGETLSVRALRFDDASGAYGAYSYYRQNGWPKEAIGNGAASDKNRVLFWVGTTVVDATFSHVEPMSAGEMREIARQLPQPSGNRALAPPILASLPQAKLDPQTTHYAVGPAGYAGAGGVLPPSLIKFEMGAETITANYSLTSGPATLTLIDYPTPQIAHAQVEAIRAYLKAGSQAQPPWPKPLNDSDVASLEVRDSGPLVAIVSGDAVPDDSHRLLESVHYEADVTAIPQPLESEIEKTSKLLLGIAFLSLIGAAAAILLGGFLGGGRALYRIATGKPASSMYDVEFIHLDLQEKWVEVQEESVEEIEAIERPHPKG
ncbi:MAG TPA: DUF6599 family protein [Terracidiphilus sp.]|nr:DUF6599 family protein [Terracidiphilus sp.]